MQVGPACEEPNLRLETLRSRVLRMGEKVEQQLIHTLDGLASGDIALLDRMIEGDREINAMEAGIDEACTHLLVQRQRAPGALRFSTAVVNIISDLKRIGDEAKNIAHTSKRIHASGRPQLPGYRTVRSAANVTLGMLRKVLDAFARQEVNAAAQVAREDSAVHHEFRSVVRLLATFMMEGRRAIPASVDILFVAMSIQRIGDHAGNIAEHVVNMAGVGHVRHTLRGEESILAMR